MTVPGTDASAYDPRFSRRTFLQWGTAAAAAFALPAVLSACGSSSTGAATSSSKSSSMSSSGSSTSTSSDVTTPLPAFTSGGASTGQTGLPKRVAWANVSTAPFFLALGSEISAAAKDRGFDYVTTVANSDPQTYVNQMDQILTRGTGAMVSGSIDLASQKAPQLQAIKSGVCMMGLVATPCTVLANTDQHAVGVAMAQSAVDYITKSLAGNAKVLVMNFDSQGPEIQKRHQAMLDTLKKGGAGIQVVVDVEPSAVTTDAGYAVGNTAIQAHPDINVVLGSSDTVAVGAYQAFQQSKALKSDMYFGGCDGDSQAIALISAGTPYRSSHAFAWPVLGYTMGQYACDWIEGKPVPRVLLVPAVNLTKDTIPVYNTDMAAASAVFADEAKLSSYITRLGSVSYQTRSTYWSEVYDPSS